MIVMATETKTAEKVVVVASPKLVTAIKSLVEVAATLESKKVAVAKVIRTEAERLGYDEKQTRQMVVLSWRAARPKATEGVSEKQLADFDKSSQPDISKVMLLAFPSNEAEVEKAIAHNVAVATGKAPAGAKRIGENTLLDIARGNQTVAKHSKGIPPKRKEKQGSKLSPDDQLGNALANLWKQFVSSESVTPKRALELVNLYFCEPKVSEDDAEKMAKADAAKHGATKD